MNSRYAPNAKCDVEWMSFYKCEMEETSKGQLMWRKAKELIPGGNMLLSKRPELFLPGKWPSYFTKSKGCKVWDLDGNKYIDFAQMSVGACLLGYGNKEVDDAVCAAVKDGNMSTLNCHEEVLLAERLIDMHPWSDQVRFARSGGEANAIAVRIARAATGRDKVAVCGYHGWHDWYLATNLTGDDGLANHLLPGLSTKGVPSSLKGTTIPFNYNDLEKIEEISLDPNLAAIKMEVQRNMTPSAGFLERIREICSDRGIILIFDECTSGFRQSFGGLHKIYGVDPDMAMFGKALGNGYAITAVVGKRNIMECAQMTFISSTFWTERLGPTAALKCLDVMEREESWKYVTKAGERLRAGIEKIANQTSVAIQLSGIPALTGFSFSSTNGQAYKTFFTQEMLKRGYLATTSTYLSMAHTDKLIDDYLENADEVFAQISKCESESLDIFSLLDGEVSHSGFKRLN
jgi:glutamate-1-semialdehyde 2,1-aminomutase